MYSSSSRCCHAFKNMRCFPFYAKNLLYWNYPHTDALQSQETRQSFLIKMIVDNILTNSKTRLQFYWITNLFMALLYRPLTINDYWETVADCSNFTKMFLNFLGNTFNLINKKIFLTPGTYIGPCSHAWYFSLKI